MEKRLNIRVSDNVHARIKAAADKECRSISQYVLMRLREDLKPTAEPAPEARFDYIP